MQNKRFFEEFDKDTLRRHRRHLHQNPEISHNEFETADYVQAELERLGRAHVFRPCATSVCALYESSNSRHEAVAFRADIDGLPIHETNEVEYRSHNDGVMHACGHDGHTAVLLAMARLLANDSRAISRSSSTLLIFQQAEEAISSGAPMVCTELKKCIKMSSIYGFHLWPDLPLGTIGVRSGCIMGGVDGVELRIHAGQVGDAHGAGADELEIDALEAGVWVHAALRPWRNRRRITAEHPVSLHIGQFLGGTEPHRVANDTVLRGCLRYTNLASRDDALKEIRSLLEESPGRTGVRIDLTLTENIRPPLTNAPANVLIIRESAVIAGVELAEYPERPLGVSDDFGSYLDLAPGAFFLVGCTRLGDHKRQLHTSHFDFPEEALDIAFRVLCNVCVTRSEHD